MAPMMPPTRPALLLITSVSVAAGAAVRTVNTMPFGSDTPLASTDTTRKLYCVAAVRPVTERAVAGWRTDTTAAQSNAPAGRPTPERQRMSTLPVGLGGRGAPLGLGRTVA